MLLKIEEFLFLLKLKYTHMCVHNHIFCPSDDGHLGGFHIFAIVKRVTIFMVLLILLSDLDSIPLNKALGLQG
jgi:hypothetical protein